MRNIILFSISVLAVVIMAFSNTGSAHIRVGNIAKAETVGFFEIVKNTVDFDETIIHHGQNVASIRPICPQMLLPNITLGMHR